MTDMPLTHCHACGRELPWNRIFVGDRAYCGDECLPPDIQPDPRIAALEADLAEGWHEAWGLMNAERDGMSVYENFNEAQRDAGDDSESNLVRILWRVEDKQPPTL